ncbi:hypothetical protein QYE76_061071 [Lolium multiflorum]|uniref:Reverse transcriptase zinc-binding domain-containing protein n=1 Tax=Lolium multiflorum TaxID=4521 RepID=A0AAD8S012_LOLMU|nr:hypothetical protein QYE76_061071 [Lolium multiflorum]
MAFAEGDVVANGEHGVWRYVVRLEPIRLQNLRKITKGDENPRSSALCTTSSSRSRSRFIRSSFRAAESLPIRDETELRAVRGILELFGQASGLRTNFTKCSVSPIACSDVQAEGAARLMECQLAPFPVKYLGIPLSTRRLTAVAFQPLVDRLADKLPTWKASMMPRAGRLTLIRSVLAVIRLHQLMVLSLKRTALKQVKKVLRGFLWAGRANANGGHCHVNWVRVCRPLRLGGLRIPDLARTATSLRVRWIWRMHTDPLRPWRGMDMHFSKTELDIFAASTFSVVGNGESTLIWEDRWMEGKAIREMAPKVYSLVPKRRRKARTVREALVDRSWISDIVGAPSALALWQYVQLWCRLRDTQLSEVQDRLVWRWTTDGQYSAGSSYDALFQGAIISGTWKLNWKSWAPPRVKFFIWLACMDRCWTGDRLARRGLPHAPRCLLCDQSEETMKHLLTGCSFSRTSAASSSSQMAADSYKQFLTSLARSGSDKAFTIQKEYKHLLDPIDENMNEDIGPSDELVDYDSSDNSQTSDTPYLTQGQGILALAAPSLRDERTAVVIPVDGSQPELDSQEEPLSQVDNPTIDVEIPDMASPINFNQFLEKEKLKSNVATSPTGSVM